MTPKPYETALENAITIAKMSRILRIPLSRLY
jgi:hypothetical protein